MKIMDSQSRSRPTKRWLILLGLFAVGYFDIGTLKSLGVFLEEMTEDLQTSIAVVGVAIGLCHGVANCLAVVNVPLLKRFSAGKLIFTGSSIATTGLSLIYFATSGIHFLLLMLVTGFGLSVVILPSHACVIDYFPDHFEIATTIVLLGSGVGMMTLPLLTEQLVMAYSWRGAILILGALNFYSCATGLLMASSSQQKRVLGEPSIFAGRSQIGEDHDETASLISEPATVDPHNIDDDRNDDGVFCFIAIIAGAAKKIFLDIFDIKVFRECPRFITICMTFFTFAVSFYGWIVFLIPNAEAKGISPDKAVLLATIGGAANIFGRLTVGFLATRLNMKPQVTYCLISVVSAGAFFCNFFTKRFSILSCFAATNGFAMGWKTVSSNLLCKDSVSDERYPAALSFSSLAFGIGEAVGALSIGLLYNITKSFDVIFCVLGAANILESCIIISPIIKDRMVAMVTTR